MFEVQDLKYATLTTVSRCGMVSFSEDILTTEIILEHYLTRLRHVPLGEEGQEDVRATALKKICSLFSKHICLGIGMTTYMFHKKANIHFLKSETKIGKNMFRFSFSFEIRKRVGRARKEKSDQNLLNGKHLKIEIILPATGIELEDSVISCCHTTH